MSRLTNRMRTLVAASALLLAGCSTDPATRLAADIEAGVDRLDGSDGARVTVEHRVPSKTGECTGSYRVQLDEVGALIVWCNDATGDRVHSSHSTTSHSRSVVTSRTWILDKAAGESLTVNIERRAGRAVIVGAH